MPLKPTGCALVVGVLVLGACAPPPVELPPVDALITEGRRLDQDGQHAAAADVFRQALEQAPDSYDAHYGLARALDLAGAFDEAREHFRRAIELAPEGSLDQAQRMLGIAWAFVGDAAQAAAEFEQVYERRLEAGILSSAAEEANELGRLYLESDRLDAAERWYRTGFETANREAGRPDWQVDLAAIRWAHAQARIAARRGQPDQARRHVQEVRRLLDKDGNQDQEPFYPQLLGYVALEAGEFDAALTHLAEADQDDPFVLMLQARAADRAGSPEQARAFYERVLASTSHGIGNAFARPEAEAWLSRR